MNWHDPFFAGMFNSKIKLVDVSYWFIRLLKARMLSGAYSYYSKYAE